MSGQGKYFTKTERGRMSNTNPFHNPFMLGFDELEDIFLSISKGAESFPPYNIEQTGPRTLRISLAVAGYQETNLEVSLEENRLIVRGQQTSEENRRFLYRGIAGRAFLKSFVLAQGLKITGAFLENGLLNIDLERPETVKNVQKITIQTKKKEPKLLKG